MKEENIEDAKVIEEKGTQENQPVQKYSELPGLLVSKVGKNEMFNVDAFLESAKKTDKKSVDKYLEERGEVVDLYAKLLDTDKKYMVLQIKNEPTMMNAALALDFACWVIPELGIYMFERMNELLLDGFSVSDRYLGIAAQQRLPKQEEAKN